VWKDAGVGYTVFHAAELQLFIVGAPPERGEATFLPTIE
jgi:hypothetical protein